MSVNNVSHLNIQHPKLILTLTRRSRLPLLLLLLLSLRLLSLSRRSYDLLRLLLLDDPPLCKKIMVKKYNYFTFAIIQCQYVSINNVLYIYIQTQNLLITYRPSAYEDSNNCKTPIELIKHYICSTTKQQ